MKFILKWLVPMLVIMLLFTAVIPLTVSAANNISVFVSSYFFNKEIHRIKIRTAVTDTVFRIFILPSLSKIY